MAGPLASWLLAPALTYAVADWGGGGAAITLFSLKALGMPSEGALDQEPGDNFSSELYPNEPCDLGQAVHSLGLCFSVCQGGSWLRTLLKFILPWSSE